MCMCMCVCMSMCTLPGATLVSSLLSIWGRRSTNSLVRSTCGDIFDHNFLLRVLIRNNFSHYLEALAWAGELLTVVELSPGKKKVKHLQVLFSQCNIVSLPALMLNKGGGCEAAPLLK